MELRSEVCRYAKKMAEAGWVSGSSGNLSRRVPDEADRYVITPTSVEYGIMAPEQVVVVNGEGDAVIEVDNAPSWELPAHVAVYQARPEVMVVMHTHAVYSSILSVLRLPLPPIMEEMVPYLGGEVQVCEYGASGSEELAANIVKALGDRAAVLVANHGNLIAAKNMAKAFVAGALVERAAQVYIASLKLSALNFGKVHAIPADVLEMERGMYEALIASSE